MFLLLCINGGGYVGCRGRFMMCGRMCHRRGGGIGGVECRLGCSLSEVRSGDGVFGVGVGSLNS